MIGCDRSARLRANIGLIFNEHLRQQVIAPRQLENAHRLAARNLRVPHVAPLRAIVDAGAAFADQIAHLGHQRHMLGQFGQAAARGNRDDLARFGRAFKRCARISRGHMVRIEQRAVHVQRDHRDFLRQHGLSLDCLFHIPHPLRWFSPRARGRGTAQSLSNIEGEAVHRAGQKARKNSASTAIASVGLRRAPLPYTPARVQRTSPRCFSLRAADKPQGAHEGVSPPAHLQAIFRSKPCQAGRA